MLDFHDVGAQNPEATMETADSAQLSKPTPLHYAIKSADASATGTFFTIFFSDPHIYSSIANGWILDHSTAGTSSRLFTGTMERAVFAPAVFNAEHATLTVKDVPEPATWAMTIIGLSMIGFAAQPRQSAGITCAKLRA